jgi:hypothetical protein
MMKKLMIAAPLAVLALTGAAQAPSGPLGELTCKGKPVTIRYGEIKPGQAALFSKAVADHQAWYTSHGNATTVAMVRVVKRGATGDLSYDDVAALTIVTYDPKSQPAHDAAYEAFVKEYRDSEDIKEEHRGCLG